MRRARTTRTSGRDRRDGHAMVEVALMMPWLILLFMGILDFGFYTYAAIATQNAANAAALYTSTDWSTRLDQATACTYALEEMNRLPNVAGLTTCSALPLTVAVTTDPDPCVAGTFPPTPCNTRVTVTYRSVVLFPIPGLMSQMTLSRTTAMRVMEL